MKTHFVLLSLLAIAFSGCATPSKKPVGHIKASVQIAFDVDDHGTPQNITIVSWTGPEGERKKIEEAAINSVKRWVLNPSLRGRHLIQPMEFDLEDDAPTSDANKLSSGQRP